MKQQQLEQQRRNALACAKQALACLKYEENRIAHGYLSRAIALLEEVQG